MNEQQPAPDFNSSQYERPNRKWICGKTAEGRPCHAGPDARGHCRVAFECQPVLKTAPGETKGRYHCTRADELGGPCQPGPLPDGTCCRPLAKCVPVRSLRSRRGLLTWFASVVTVGFLLVALCGPYRAAFVNPGRLSAGHATGDFRKLAGKDNNCGVCHKAGRGRLATWVKVGLAARPGPFQFRTLALPVDEGMTTIDKNCLVCHTSHSFHEPNVISDHSCSGCHTEHKGPGPMPLPTDASCGSCHANKAVMEASADRGEKLPASAFDFRPEFGHVVFHTPRPGRGFTEIIHSFATDHPEFALLSQKLKDPDTLKFNHALHLDAAKVTRGGKPLQCIDCHKLESSGVYHLKVAYEANCKSCHTLQFDARNPGLVIPHGSAEGVRAFLRSLPRQYADFAARTLGPGNAERNETFAREQIARLRSDFGSGEELERAVFFNDKERGPDRPSIFPGCAYCHEVHPSENAAPHITPPVMPDRWLAHSRFDHSKHLRGVPTLPNPGCVYCHDAPHSRSASDIILPSIQVCVKCHSPAGGVASSCSTCHDYHTLRKDSVLTESPGIKGSDSAETWRRAIAFHDN